MIVYTGNGKFSSKVQILIKGNQIVNSFFFLSTLSWHTEINSIVDSSTFNKKKFNYLLFPIGSKVQGNDTRIRKFRDFRVERITPKHNEDTV